MNHNIKASYHDSKGVIFQTNFNKELVFKWFGPHPNYAIINNGADVLTISDFQVSEQIKTRYEPFENIWSCAASWHPFKRLKDNIKYFLNFAGSSDCLIVCGNNPDYVIEHPRIFYVGNLSISDLISVYKISKYFIHLAYLDHCPNVVIDARACGCNIICSSAGGTQEIAGPNAIIVNEPEWDYGFLESPKPPTLEFNNITGNSFDSKISMASVAKKYLNFLKENK
jgi:glycosyltransferase involved in cell wall biosynthesis